MDLPHNREADDSTVEFEAEIASSAIGGYKISCIKCKFKKESNCYHCNLFNHKFLLSFLQVQLYITSNGF